MAINRTSSNLADQARPEGRHREARSDLVSFGSWHELRAALAVQGQEAVAQLAEQGGWQEAIGGIRSFPARAWPQVRPWPEEDVDLGQHDPGAFLVETEMTLHGGGQLHGRKPPASTVACSY